MSLPPPSYIPLSLLKNMSVQHRWDDWDPYPLLGTQDEATERRLARLSDRAQIAYAIACAEWVVYRFHDLCDDIRPYFFLESAWASEMSADFVIPPLLDAKEWQGPIRGPIDLSLVTIYNTFYSTEDGAGHVDAAFAERISLHVITPADIFLEWKELILGRLEDLFRRDSTDTTGVPVPREAMDPALPMSEEVLSEYVAHFLYQLDEESNPFLRRTQQSSE